MKLVDLRVEHDGDSAALETARAFLDLLCSKDPSAARAKASPDFRWFGRSIGEGEWNGPQLVAFFGEVPTRQENAREVPVGVLDLLNEDDRATACDGAVDEGEHVVLVDLDRGAQRFTVGLVVERTPGPDPRVRRVFDPMTLAESLRRTGAPG